MSSPADELLRRLMAGEPRALARVCRLLDELSVETSSEPSTVATGRALQTGLYKSSVPRSWIVGITGSPGAGKSSLVDALIAEIRAARRTCCVLAVDPSSPFSGGAILGDRIRMQRHYSDPGVFIRSLATRGALGGLTRSCSDLQRACAAWGADVVLLETVGVGQDELDVIAAADTTCVVVAPGMGDDVQASKAGILEVADVLVVNKADLAGAARTIADLRGMLALSQLDLSLPSSAGHGAHHGPALPPPPARAGEARASPAASQTWSVPLVECVAIESRGVAGVLQQLNSHRTWLETTPGGKRRRAARAETRSRKRLLDEALVQLVERCSDEVDRLSRQLTEGEIAPLAAAAELLRSARELTES